MHDLYSSQTQIKGNDNVSYSFNGCDESHEPSARQQPVAADTVEVGEGDGDHPHEQTTSSYWSIAHKLIMKFSHWFECTHMLLYVVACIIVL